VADVNSDADVTFDYAWEMDFCHLIVNSRKHLK